MDNPGKIDKFIENTAANAATAAYVGTVGMVFAGFPLGGTVGGALAGLKLAGIWGATAGAVVGLAAGIAPCLVISAHSPKTGFLMLETLGEVVPPVENVTRKILSPLRNLSRLFAHASSLPADKKDAPKPPENLPPPYIL
jgi:hypothetical protein